MCRRDWLGHEADVPKAREIRGGAKPRRRALVGILGADEAHRTAERDLLWRDAGQLLGPQADVREDQRDQLFESLRASEDVRPRLERIAEERLESLEEAARSAQVGVDVRLDRRLFLVGRGHPNAEHLKLAPERPAGSVVFEVRLDRRPPHQGGAVATDVEDRGHRLSRKRIDGEDTGRGAVVDRKRRI